MDLRVKPCAGMVCVEELGPIEQAMGKRLVVPDCGGYDPRNSRTWKPVHRRMRGRVVSVAKGRSRDGTEYETGVEEGMVVWYWEGVAKGGYRWREGDGREYAMVAARELICEEVE